MTCNMSIFSIGLKDDQPCIHETGGVHTRTTETVEPREASERLLGLKCCFGIAVLIIEIICIFESTI